MHPYYRDAYHYCDESFPVAKREYYRSFSLPIFPGMTQEQISYVIEQVIEVVTEVRR
jgi:dTDP-4-amino-4,6-dideoxygalactose transaminase